MKTAQEALPEFDRMSTHEELHQVLALLDERAPVPSADAPSEPEDTEALREAVADLWRDAVADDPHGEAVDEKYGQELEVRGVWYPWADMLAGKTDRIN